MIKRTKYLKRSPIKRTALKRKPRKKRAGDDPDFKAWLAQWPCFICLLLDCTNAGSGATVFNAIVGSPEMRRLASRRLSRVSGETQVAHIGLRGIGQKCPDRQAMPLCAIHHLHQTAGGGPDSHHTIGRAFWSRHGIDRDNVIAILNELYRKETGK